MGRCGARAPYVTGHDVENAERNSSSGPDWKYPSIAERKLPRPEGGGGVLGRAAPVWGLPAGGWGADA
jgi:hypothetical protein